MEQFTDSENVNSAMCPATVFYNILNQIQASHLNFQLQLSPFSAVISLKKTFVKNKSGTILYPQTTSHNLFANIVEKNCEHEKDIINLKHMYEEAVEDCAKANNEIKGFMHENEHLKEIINKKKSQLESAKNEVLILQTQLGKAEDELVKHLSETKAKDAKSFSEIAALKSRIKESSENIMENKREASNAVKNKKVLEKNIYTLEKKIDNLNNTVESLKASKNVLKTEKDILTKEIKKFQKNSKLKVINSLSTQTDDLNNNMSIKLPHIQSSSSSSQTETEVSEIFECYVCGQVFDSASQIREHTYNIHDIKLNLETLLDISETDSFVRFVKSIVLGNEYINARIKLYPEHWDHVSERIKIRMLAQKKLEICSWHIENNMRKIAERNFKYPMRDCELAEI